MSFDIGEYINTLSDRLLTAPIVMKIARNPIYTAVTIVFIILLVIMFVWRGVDAQDYWSLLMRTGFWLVIMLTGVIFIHNRVLSCEYAAAAKSDEMMRIFGQGEMLDDNVMPVNISLPLD